MRDLPMVGERVLVSIGVEDVEAEVVEVYGWPGHEHVRLRIDIVGSSGERLDDYITGRPVDWVRRIQAA
jgi:hypothetical protein